jgi:hypothetical protein
MPAEGSPPFTLSVAYDQSIPTEDTSVSIRLAMNLDSWL